jgi:hypothetical protein
MFELWVVACLISIPDRCMEVKVNTFPDRVTCVGSAIPATIEWTQANPRSQVAKMRCKPREQAT